MKRLGREDGSGRRGEGIAQQGCVGRETGVLAPLARSAGGSLLEELAHWPVLQVAVVSLASALLCCAVLCRHDARDHHCARGACV